MVMICVSRERTVTRARLFMDRFSDLTQNDPLLFGKYSIEEDHALATAEAYFLLSDAYKHRRGIPSSHPTEHSKVAAISAIAIGYLCPLRCVHPHKDSNLEDQMINPIFGVRLGMQRINFSESLSMEEYDRIAQGFRRFSFGTLDSYLKGLRDSTHSIGNTFDVNLTESELIFLEDKISIFHAYGRYAELRQQFMVATRSNAENQT